MVDILSVTQGTLTLQELRQAMTSLGVGLALPEAGDDSSPSPQGDLSAGGRQNVEEKASELPNSTLPISQPFDVFTELDWEEHSADNKLPVFERRGAFKLFANRKAQEALQPLFERGCGQLTRACLNNPTNAGLQMQLAQV